MFLEQASLFLSALIHKDIPEKAVTFDRCRESDTSNHSCKSTENAVQRSYLIIRSSSSLWLF